MTWNVSPQGREAQSINRKGNNYENQSKYVSRNDKQEFTPDGEQAERFHGTAFQRI